MAFRTGDGLEVNGILVVDSGGNIQSVPSIAVNQAKSSMDATNLKLEVNGNASIRGANALFFGVSSNNYNSWKGKIWNNNTSTMYVNAQEFNVNNSGYGSSTFLKANASGVDGTSFRDLDNTAYYANPAGTSVFNGATFAATPTVNGNTVLTSNAGINANNINSGTINTNRIPDFVHIGNANGTGYSTDDGSWGSRLNVSSNIHAKIEVSQQANSMRSHWFAHTGQDSIKFGTSTAHDVEIQRGGTTRIEATSGGATITGIGQATTDFRAPIYYDSNNTTNFLDISNGTVAANLYGTIKTQATHADGNLVLYYTGSSDTNTGVLTAWISEPGLTYSDGGIGNNVNTQGPYYGREVNSGYGVYARFKKSDGYFETWTTQGNRYTTGGQGTRRFWVDPSGNSFAQTSFRGPVFYDSSNTDFRVDPVSTSHLYGTLYLGHTNSQPGTLVIYDTGNNALQMQGTGANAFKFDMIGTGSTGTITFNDFNLVTNKNVRINAGTSDYTGQTNVDETILRMQTDFDAAGSQNLQFVNHNGNWLDGTTGADTAFGWMWSHGNNQRAGIIYDHRSTEKFDIYSSYGEIRFRTPASVNGNISPIGSESSMPARLTIGVGGAVTASTDMRAPIFYDSNDTARYLDMNGTNLSELGKIRTNASGTQTAPRWDTSFYVAQSQHYYGHSGSQTMYLGEANHIHIRNIADIAGSARAPVYYDKDNTNYYVDPTSASVSARFDGPIHFNRSAGTSYDFSVKVGAYNHPTAGYTSTTDKHWVGLEAKGGTHIILNTDGGDTGSENAMDHFTVWQGGIDSTAKKKFWVTNIGNTYAKTSMRAPIYYDKDNTNYYLDAHSTGTSLNVAGNAIIPGYAQIAGTELSSGDTASFSNINNDDWVTVCDFSGSRKADIIEIYENESSRHNYVKLEVSWSYGQGSINVINGVRHGNHTMLKVRLLYNTADRIYGTGKLQVYMYNWSTSYTLRIKQTGFGKSNWGKATVKTSAEQGTPSGYTEHEDSVMNIIEDANGAFGSTGRVTAGGGIDIYNGKPIRFHTDNGDGTTTERGFIDAVEGGHLRVATSGGENIVFQDGGVGGTTNLTILGSGEMVKEATERFTIKSHTNSWDGGLRFYASDNSTIFQMHPDTNGQMYVDREWRFQNSQINYGPIRRGGHNVGHLEGSYNNIGGNGAQSNPIYTIGSGYNPGTTTLSNMYGIGYTNVSASFISGSLAHGDWGMYVAADGDARIFLDGSNGHGNFAGTLRGTALYDYDNTGYWVDPNNSHSKMVGLNLHGGANNNTNDAVLYINKTSTADWAIKVRGTSSSTEYGIINDLVGTHSYNYRAMNSGSEYSRLGTDMFYHNSSIRAPIFYDSDNTDYYMNLSTNDNSLVMRGTIHVGPEGNLGLGDLTHPKRVIPGSAAAWSGSGTTTGQVVIDLPGTLSNYDMLYFEVDVYEYSAKNATKIIVGGHNWNTGGNSGTSNLMWYNVGVKVIGDMDKPIYFGWRNNGSVNKRVMVIGSPTSSWSYGTVRVSSVSGADDFYADAIDYTGDWAVTQSTSSSYYTKSPNTDFNSIGTQTLKTHGRMQAYGYQGNGNVGGTGSASWHPSGIYSNGTNWLYGAIYMNNNIISGNRYIEFGAGSGHSHEMSTHNANDIRFRTSSDGAAGILLQDNSGNFRAQLYGDGSNYGFLDGNWAGWDIQKTVNGSMYLNGNTSYYVNYSGTSFLNTLKVNQFQAPSSSASFIWQDSGGTADMRLDASTNLTVRGNVTAYGNPSDIRLKENVEIIPDALNKVNKLDGITFNYKKDGSRSTGLVAQQLQEVLPEVVYETEDIDTDEKHLAVRYGNVVGLLVEAIKELKAEVDDLKEQLKNK